MRGYSQIIIEANQAAEKNPGVELGALCISLKFPVTQVAKRLNISRQAVYDWFSGRAKPARSSYTKIHELIEELKQ